MTLAVGFFDGVHLGHRAILSGADRALTFTNHPLSVLAPPRAPRLIMPFDVRAQAMRAAGAGAVTALAFTPALAAEPPARFLARLTALAGGTPPAVRCGANWRFGAGGAGDAAWLRAHGVAVTVVPYAVYEGEPVSSTRIRRALEDGRLTAANAMLGRPFAVRGVPFAGKGAGRALGFPTVNLHLPELALRLPRGAYAVRAGGVRGVANFGCAPTMGARAWPHPVLEIHFLGAPPPDPTPVDCLAFLRPERIFPSVAALREQIARDVADAARVPDGPIDAC